MAKRLETARVNIFAGHGFCLALVFPRLASSSTISSSSSWVWRKGKLDEGMLYRVNPSILVGAIPNAAQTLEAHLAKSK
jgi:hypothetical protein